ncbi:Predicted esterase [Nonlabens sp. Hel1_33_55]|uniref:alpha/beta hydrolase n=1 Tax=Nonlabens sp. Hel1_33_55 TaxID=1336802 RepID=UPI000875C5F5|nr:alpha/beta fold hydrolase [Nonlabens sp. Hel1_33_55]SCX95411.1 Predicted esterase [Nonlabens sp. Hel1_33_55]
MVKTVSYKHTNSYEVLYPIKKSTENIWICFHGLGYLARFFKKYFKDFDPDIHAVFVLQAPSKFYLGKEFKHVGASWLTKVDTVQEMKNNINYIDQVLEIEDLLDDPRLVFMGYSQGVSIATRYLKHYARSIKALILHSGSIPDELNEEDGQLFRQTANRIIHIVGTKDEYLTDERIKKEQQKIDLLFRDTCELHRPDIKHEVDTQLLKSIAKTL